MKNILLLFQLFLFLSVSGKNFNHFLFPELLPVIDTSISKVHIYVNFGKKEDTLLCNIAKYDALGRFITFITLNKDSKSVFEISNKKYYGNTDIVESTSVTFYDKNKNPITTNNVFQYDSLLRKVYDLEFGNDTQRAKIKQYFYHKDKLFKIENRNSNKSDPSMICLHYYDAMNRIIKKDFYNQKKEILYSEIYEYTQNFCSHYLSNKNGKELKQIEEFRGDQLITRYTSEDIQTIEASYYDIYLKRHGTKIAFYYDANARLSEVTYSINELEMTPQQLKNSPSHGDNYFMKFIFKYYNK
jgi:hypothetical protein